MTVKTVTKSDSEKFDQALWALAHDITPEFIFPILYAITEKVELNEDTEQVLFTFTQAFQDIQESEDESK